MTDRDVEKEGWLRDIDGNQKQIDILWKSTQGYVTIEIAGNPDHECHNAFFVSRCEDIIKHVIVALDKAVLTAVKKKLSNHPQLKGTLVIEVISLPYALSGKWSL